MSGLSNKDNDDNEEVWKYQCKNCIRCNEKQNCGACWPCRGNKTCEKRRCFSARKMYDESVRKVTDENLKAIMAKTAAREAAQAASTSSAGTSAAAAPAPKIPEPVEPVEKKKRGRKKKEVLLAQQRMINERDYVPHRPTRQQSADMRRKRTQFNFQSAPDKQPRQCLNPDCIIEARPESKYCSDECGTTLAKMRLAEFLPQRCKQYFGPGPAGTPRTIEDEIRQKREAVKVDMNRLGEAEKHMIGFLEKLHEFVDKQIKLQPLGAQERFDDNLYEACIVCGTPDVPLRKYTKHIDLCWSRSEKAMSFGALEKSNDKFYCEFYDARNGSFCKRLKSLCPEHRKPGIEIALKVCGYPKKWENTAGGGEHVESFNNSLSELIESEDPFGEEGCRTKKDVCHKHHKWIPSLRGSIELEQASLFQKIFELCHENTRLNTQAEWSTNALSVLLHKEPKIVDNKGFLSFIRAQQAAADAAAIAAAAQELDESNSSISSTSKSDPDMVDAAQFLASLVVKKEADAIRAENGGDDDDDMEDMEDEEGEGDGDDREEEDEEMDDNLDEERRGRQA